MSAGRTLTLKKRARIYGDVVVGPTNTRRPWSRSPSRRPSPPRSPRPRTGPGAIASAKPAAPIRAAFPLPRTDSWRAPVRPPADGSPAPAVQSRAPRTRWSGSGALPLERRASDVECDTRRYRWLPPCARLDIPLAPRSRHSTCNVPEPMRPPSEHGAMRPERAHVSGLIGWINGKDLPSVGDRDA